MTTREEVYRALDSECAYQAADAGYDFSSIDRTLHVILMCIGQHLSTGHSEIDVLELLRKVGALCVGSMEEHGASEREGAVSTMKILPVGRSLTPSERDILLKKANMLNEGEAVSISGEGVLAPTGTSVQTIPVKTGDQELDAMLRDMGETDGC